MWLNNNIYSKCAKIAGMETGLFVSEVSYQHEEGLVLKRLLATTALSLMSFGALAADLPRRSAAFPPSPIIVAPLFTWSGFYAGAHAGYMWGDVKVNYEGTPGGGEMKGFIGGAIAGYNWQRGSIVYGVEADLGLGAVDGRGIIVCSFVCPIPVVPLTEYSYDLKWNGHIRGRLGFAAHRTLFFVAGGLAVARHTLGELVNGSMDHSHRGTHYGWTVGAGIEQAWSTNFITRVEYLYDDYGRKTYDREDDLRVNLTSHTVRAALIWKF